MDDSSTPREQTAPIILSVATLRPSINRVGHQHFVPVTADPFTPAVDLPESPHLPCQSREGQPNVKILLLVLRNLEYEDFSSFVFLRRRQHDVLAQLWD